MSARPPTSWVPPPALAFGFDLLALVFMAANVAIVASAEPQNAPSGGFFSEPVAAIMLLSAACAAITGGALAAVSLFRLPPDTKAGRWSVRLAVTCIAIMPAVALLVTGFTALAGIELAEGWGEILAPVWFGLALVATFLGVIAKEPGRRGTLVIPLIIGGLVLVFTVGEIATPH